MTHTEQLRAALERAANSLQSRCAYGEANLARAALDAAPAQDTQDKEPKMPPDSMIFEQILDRHVVQLTKLFEEMEYSPSRAREYALFRTCQIALEEASDVDVLRNTMLYILETYHTPD